MAGCRPAVLLRLGLGSIQATGPVVLAACREYDGSTDAFFYASAGAAVLLATAAWLVRPPQEGSV